MLARPNKIRYSRLRALDTRFNFLFHLFEIHDNENQYNILIEGVNAK